MEDFERERTATCCGVNNHRADIFHKVNFHGTQSVIRHPVGSVARDVSKSQN